MTGPFGNQEAFANQAGAELAFAKSMGWDDRGMVSYHVQWSLGHEAGLAVHDDDARSVLVTGVMPGFKVHGWTTRRRGQAARRIGEG
jgi:hypothetical protein